MPRTPRSTFPFSPPSATALRAGGRWLLRGYAALMLLHGASLLRNRSPRVVPTITPQSPPDTPRTTPAPPHLPAKYAPLHAPLSPDLLSDVTGSEETANIPQVVAPPPLVSIILPARDEEENIIRCLQSLLPQQTQGRPVHICAVDDASRDATGALLDAFHDALSAQHPNRLMVRHLQETHDEETPSDWAGKPRAMHAGTALAQGEWLLFTDADTVWQPGAVEALVGYAQALGIDLLTVLPREVLPTLIERLVAPALLQTLFQTASPAAVNDPRRRAVALANGQCLLLRRSVYTAIGGYARSDLRGAILDDTALARVVKRAGYRLQMAAGQELLTVRMYPSGPAAWQGWRRNIGASFRPYARPVATLLFALFAVVSTLPYALTLAGLLSAVRASRLRRVEERTEMSICAGTSAGSATGTGVRRTTWGLNEPLLAGVCSLGVTLGGFAWAIRALELPLWYTLCHPVSLALELLLMGQAWSRRLRGVPITWRGRAYLATSAAPRSSPSSPSSSDAPSSSAPVSSL